MSFILDALKKSEAERQRQAGPTLLELRITRPIRRYPLWATIVGVLLGINVVVLLTLLLRRPFMAAPESSAVNATAAAAMPSSAATAPAATPPRVSASAALESASAAQTISAGPGSAVAPSASTQRESANAATSTADTANPADDEPAVAPAAVSVQRAENQDYASLPSSSEVGGNMPALQLDLLDYSDQPSERYALINMHRVREGDVLPEGARVVAITRDGVALSYRGQDFMLRPEGAAQ